MTVWPTDRGRVAASIHTLSTSWVYFLILWIRKKSSRRYLFFPHPSGSPCPPLMMCSPSLEATGVLGSCPHFSTYPSGPSLLCTHLPIHASSLQNTLLQSTWPLPSFSPLFVSGPNVCPLSCPRTSMFCSSFPWASAQLFHPTMTSLCS